MTVLNSHLRSLKDQVEAAPWLKWAFAAIAVLIAVIALQQLDDIRKERQKAAISTELSLRQINSLKGQTVWLEREAEAAKVRDALLAQLPEVATAGMAQAATQSWLRSLSGGFESQQSLSLRINNAALLEDMPGIMRVNAAVNGSMSPRQAMNLIRQIETSPNLVVVETVTLQSTEHSMLSLTLNAYYRIKSESES